MVLQDTPCQEWLRKKVAHEWSGVKITGTRGTWTRGTQVL
jgi:hypothetical protein